MSYDLHGAGGGYLKFNEAGWRTILALARQYGWEPAGTLPNVGYLEARATGTKDPEALVSEWVEKWDGGYFANEHQVVTDEDAARLAEALERALADFPDNDALAGALASVPDPPAWIADMEHALDGVLYTMPPNWDIDGLRQFVGFCKAGGFSIG